MSLNKQSGGLLPEQPVPALVSIAFKALNLMGGDIDWAGLPFVSEMLGFDDVERMVNIMRAITMQEYSPKG